MHGVGRRFRSAFYCRWRRTGTGKRVNSPLNMGAPDKPISDSAQATAILVVEDEFLVRMFTVDALEDAGFRVVQAGTAAEAMAALRGTTDFGAALVDIGLPDRPGDQLAEEIHALRADLPIVIASGRSSRELRERFAG